MTIERFDIEQIDYYSSEMMNSETGDYVFYNDYITEVTNLNQRIDYLNGELDIYLSIIDEKNNELTNLLNKYT